MLSTNKLRSIYSKIQTQLFYMIPEKWDSIYLYASIIEQVNHLETGEMFFYYYPAGLLKRNPVNVYEIPNKFNIDEEEYMKLVEKLYSTFGELRQAFKESLEEKMWTNLTITIQNSKFNIEYSYDDLIGTQYTSYDRHIIWKCKYLDFPTEALSRKDRKMLANYYLQNAEEEKKTKSYTEGMYKKKVHNIIEFRNNEQNDFDDLIYPENNTGTVRDESYKIIRKNSIRNKVDRYEQYKHDKEIRKIRKKEQQEKLITENQKMQNKQQKNQILNI